MPNNRFAVGLNANAPNKLLLLVLELEPEFKLLTELPQVLGVVILVFANFVPLENGEFCDENPVFNKSVGFKRNRSRKSHAEVCLISTGLVTTDSFFVVLNVARAGLIGVIEADVSFFTADDVVGFEIFAFGVNFEDILSYFDVHMNFKPILSNFHK